MILDPKYSTDLPVTYTQASVLLDSIIDYSNDPSRRKAGHLFYRVAGSVKPCCILGRYCDVELAAQSGVSSTTGADQLLKLSDEIFPQEIRRAGLAFLRDAMAFSDNSANWRAARPTAPPGSATPVSALTGVGKLAARRLISRYGLEGISQSNGLSALVA